jgi:hypothetical protein
MPKLRVTDREQITEHLRNLPFAPSVEGKHYGKALMEMEEEEESTDDEDERDRDRWKFSGSRGET